MRCWWMIGMLAWGVGCGGKQAPVASTDGLPTGFIEITLDDEDEEDWYPALQLLTAECGDLVQLEPAAMMGRLSDPEIQCLDTALKNAERTTVKGKISRVLMKDAWSKGNPDRWEGIVRRHLDDIGRADPDLCYKFARYLSTYKGSDAFEETMKWADMALANRFIWEGDLHVKRVYALHRVKTLAAHRLWEDIEGRYVAGPTEELLNEKDEARLLVKTLAREWLEYARQAERDPTLPLELCLAASGTGNFCAET